MSARPRIVCAVDRSEPARRAVDAARWLARELAAAIVVIHAFDEWAIGVPPTGELVGRSLATDDVVRAARDDAERLLLEASAALAGVEHTVELVEDPAVEGVLRAAREHDARLLVTGTDAPGGVDRILLGSVASELAAKSPCPVAVVPPGALLSRPGPVLAAYDGSEHSRAAARHAATLATRMQREMVVVHAADDRGEPDPGGAPLERELGLHVETLRVEVDAAEAIARAAQRRDAALVVAGTRGRGPISAALLGSVSAGLVRSAERPVVLVPATYGSTSPRRIA